MSQRTVFLFWLPLFSSWLLMTAEGPLITAAINRLPNEVVMLAAMGIVFSLAVAIESPIIHLLATATALVRDRQSYAVVRRFTLLWMAVLTGVVCLLAFSPLFDLVVRRWLGTPAEIAGWVRVGLRIMVPWPAAIAWRRFQQGVLIQAGRTRLVARGTALRLATSGSLAIGLALWGRWSGVVIGGLALAIGVVAEALYATQVAAPVRDRLAAGPPGGSALGHRRLLAFHLPLASTSVLTLLAQPLVAASLARLDRPVESLSAWPILFQFMLVMRAPAFALPEVVIALSREENSFRVLRRFSLRLAAVSGAFMSLFVLTPAAAFYLGRVQSASLPVAELARQGFLYLLPLPPLAALIAWLRGLLIERGATQAVNGAMALRLAATAGILLVGVSRGWAGIATAALALDLSGCVEVGWLLWRARAAFGASVLA